jgi:hypothetical protein
VADDLRDNKSLWLWAPDRVRLRSLVRDDVDLIPFSNSFAAIASEAKQSISPRKERMDCFVASLLEMTSLIETCIDILAA